MTPALKLLKGKPHRTLEYAHDPRAPAYGEEAAQALGLEPARVFKTLVCQLEGSSARQPLVVAVVPVTGTLNLKALARACHARKAALAPHEAAERATGYVVGGISPLGQKKRLPLWVDDSAEGVEEMFISGGRRGLEIGLAPALLCELGNGQFAPLARED
ncbi:MULTISPECIES: aminoacyl-tRNA deacylase [Cobetia]|jgi:Cys-tRNA(Pro)/Cys-tRNA(Cys) deacylase|uniref:Cys-tRNA(Pro)/Cys-tRNA(Cys) deacylase n=1 Tax=Cobetia marina TaxID=28258 RepID=A0ABU9GKG7_COBMA|nr:MULTISPECIES: aminoacyl-tRNA deacylase [Cobetia]MDI6005243.1 aminoacyl-tRNA deacylase [Cobetia pacifica]POR07802.1 aminoacyl-tRNA deacylase [Cobetia sp. MM1IDA2H-1]